MKLGLYSITYLGLWYDGPALSLPELIRRARRYGYDGIEIDGKRPHGNPLDLPPSFCRELRARAADEGIEIYAMAANNDFSSPIAEHRESQLIYVRDLLRAASDLGAKTVRVFAGWPGVFSIRPGGGSYTIAERIWEETHKDFCHDQVWDWCRDCLIEASRRAGDAGVVLALQNHPQVIHSFHDMLRMIREVDSPHLKACFDAPLARTQKVKDMRAAAAEVGDLQVLSHFGGEYDEEPDGEVAGWVRLRSGRLIPEDFYSDFAAGMRDIGYEGYIGYELCHPLPEIGGKLAGIEFADKNARLAAQFMRGILASAPQTTGISGD